MPSVLQIRDQARRFITLVDELYNHRVRLVCSAQDTPDRLFVTAQAGDEEAILDMMDLEGLQSETAVEGQWRKASFPCYAPFIRSMMFSLEANE